MWPDPPIATWHLEAGDPTLLAWTVTIGYLITSFLCIRAALAKKRMPFSPGPSEPWWLLATLTAFLGINKELDLQTLAIEIARNASRSEGWYALRRGAQKAFTIAVLATAALLAWRFIRSHGKFLGRNRTLTTGLCLVILYAVLRITAINHVEFNSAGDDEPHVMLFLELLGVSLFAFGTSQARNPRS